MCTWELNRSKINAPIDLPACRRLLFPLLHACNKGNRRRLHAGNRSIRNFILSPGSFPGKPRRLTMVCARPGEWGICTGSTGRICSENFALKSSYFSHDSSHSENVASARRVLFTSSSKTPSIRGRFSVFPSQFALHAQFTFLQSVIHKDRKTIISLTIICHSTSVFLANV